MSSKLERPSSLHDLIDDIIETPSSSNPISFRLRNTSKALQNRNYLSFSSIPSLFDKSRFEQTGHSLITLTNELHDHAHVTLPRSNSSIISMSNDDRRKEIDLIIKYLYDGKLLTTINDDHAVSDVSDPSMHMLNKGPITTTTTTTPIVKNDEENNNNVGNIDFLPLDIDTSTLQRELQEKELDIIHLHKEIQELQLENKLLKAKVPTVYSNDYASNNSEIEALRREKEILQNELHTSQELIAKFQQQQQHSVRSNKIDEITLQQKEILEKKLKFYEKQMRTLTDENEKLKQNLHQTERIIAQYKRENEELQQKVTEAKKHNDELFFQEFNSFRNDLKMLKQRNNELCEQNLRLQQEKLNFSWHSSTHEQQQQQMPSSSSLKISNSDTKNLKISRSESPNISEASDSTNYLATVSIDRYHTRPSSSAHRSRTVDENHHCYRTKKYNSFIGHEDIHRNNSMTPLSKSIDQQFNFHSSKIQRAIQWNEENIPKNEDKLFLLDITNYDDDHQTINNTKSSSHFYQSNYPVHRSMTFNEHQHHSQRSMNNDTNNHRDDRRQSRKHIEIATPRRPYAPLSISDIHLNDLIKFTRPGGKISKGIVKYIGSLPSKTGQYLGLELENEESKHDGVYQDKRLFQCKPNKGIFIGFNKVIMAWSGT
ncbi:unnamed protein product [Rotaria sordida]|uniref:CAP-Gly domain-containing protein n=1 Tax=Rotaria sordida TaxID=392033 RepID=A0A818T291_9BILA|nr:unnamed protein product [Rotaria sordida]